MENHATELLKTEKTDSAAQFGYTTDGCIFWKGEGFL
jgi:hypothetical protein